MASLARRHTGEPCPRWRDGPVDHRKNPMKHRIAPTLGLRRPPTHPARRMHSRAHYWCAQPAFLRALRSWAATWTRGCTFTACLTDRARRQMPRFLTCDLRPACKGMCRAVACMRLWRRRVADCVGGRRSPRVGVMQYFFQLLRHYNKALRQRGQGSPLSGAIRLRRSMRRARPQSAIRLWHGSLLTPEPLMLLRVSPP